MRKKYGNWTVIGTPEKNSKGKTQHYKVLCRCICGQERMVDIDNLKRGKTKSCGCSKNGFLSEKAKQRLRGRNIYLIDGEKTTVYDMKGKNFIIDTEDLGKIEPYYFRIDKYGYARTCNTPQIGVHNIITPAPEGFVVDHINRNKADNRKSNLRICTYMQNSWNRSRSVGATKVRSGKWVATIRVNGNRLHLGTFDTENEAIQAKKVALKKYCGEFAPC